MEVTIAVTEMIEVKVCRGNGTKDSPYRTVSLYFDKTGALRAEDDPCLPVAYNAVKGIYEAKGE